MRVVHKMAEEFDCKCVVCKQPMNSRNTAFVNEAGPICGVVCLQYLNERNDRGINEADDLKEVQMLL